MPTFMNIYMNSFMLVTADVMSLLSRFHVSFMHISLQKCYQISFGLVSDLTQCTVQKVKLKGQSFPFWICLKCQYWHLDKTTNSNTLAITKLLGCVVKFYVVCRPCILAFYIVFIYIYIYLWIIKNEWTLIH